MMRANHDLLIVEPENEKVIRRELLGNNELYLPRKCPCPIWVLKPDNKCNFDRILVAIDPSSSNQQAKDLNSKHLELSTSLAKKESAEHHVIHCWEAYGESMMRSPGYAGSKEDVDNCVRETEKIARDQLRGCVRSFVIDTENKNVHLINEDPKLVIADFIKKNNIDLIVMGTLARSGIKGLLIENTAEKLVSGIKCSLLAVKPDGFISPVTI